MIDKFNIDIAEKGSKVIKLISYILERLEVCVCRDCGISGNSSYIKSHLTSGSTLCSKAREARKARGDSEQHSQKVQDMMRIQEKKFLTSLKFPKVNNIFYILI